MPALGFGTYSITGPDAPALVGSAIDAGYRLLDTATRYENEEEVGEAVRGSSVPRDDLFVTSKLPGADHGYDEALRSVEGSLKRLGLDRLDLFLIHWPQPPIDKYVQTWKAFIRMRQEGTVSSIGVSNFLPEHLDRLLEETGVAPAVNQVELHPYFQQAGLRHEHSDLGIVTEAWSPLAQGRVLDDATITQIAQDTGKTPGQVVIRWHLQLGNVVIPKSVTPERIEANADVFDFHLTEAQMDAVNAMDAGVRTGPDPDTFVRPPS
jgi:diketogulonate reductase-like aldo/keto reductase